jgi:quercetin dioxygenase-like cupin family protein
MHGRFMLRTDVALSAQDWGQLGWLSSPAVTGARQLTVIAASIFPGQGHDFHHHPGQEEVMYIVAGTVEQWLDGDRRMLAAGDCVFIPAGMVHASFNAGSEDAEVIAILGPCVGDIGLAQVDVSGEAPWNALRGATS